MQDREVGILMCDARLDFELKNYKHCNALYGTQSKIVKCRCCQTNKPKHQYSIIG